MRSKGGGYSRVGVHGRSAGVSPVLRFGEKRNAAPEGAAFTVRGRSRLRYVRVRMAMSPAAARTAQRAIRPVIPSAGTAPETAAEVTPIAIPKMENPGAKGSVVVGTLAAENGQV